MSDFDFLEPIPKVSATVKLPSRGVLYSPEHPASGGKLTLTPMTMVDESLLMGDEPIDTLIDRILRRCLVEKLDVNSLIGSDKFFLFIMLRAITYGSSYTFTWTCSKSLGVKPCGHTNTMTVNIPDSFKVKFLADTDKEPFTVTLPDSGKEISFRLLRGSDEPTIEAYTKEIKQKQDAGISTPDTTFVYRLMRHITGVDGHSVKDAPPDKLMAFITSLGAVDRQYLQKQIAFFTPGLDTLIKTTCEKCQNGHEMEMPYLASFFRAISDENEGGTVADEVRPHVLSADEE